MDFFASTYTKNNNSNNNNRGQDGDPTTPHRPSSTRRAHSISFPHSCPQQQGYGYQTVPLLRRTSQGLSEGSLSPTPEEPSHEPGYSEGCQFDSGIIDGSRSPSQRPCSHRLSHYNTAPNLLEHYHTTPASTNTDSDDRSRNSQYTSYYVSNPCLSHHVNASGNGSVQRPSFPSAPSGRGALRGHKKSYSDHGGSLPQLSIPTADDCVPHNAERTEGAEEGNDDADDKEKKKAEDTEEACRIRNSQQILQNADATVSSKGRLFPTSQYVQHLHQYLRRLHKDVKDNAARLMARGSDSPPRDTDMGIEGVASDTPPRSPAPQRLHVVTQEASDMVRRTPSPLTAQAMAKGGMNDLPDSTQDVYAALASPAESYTLQRRMSQYGYSDPTLLAKLSLKEGESGRCVRVHDRSPLHHEFDDVDHRYQPAAGDIIPQPDDGSRSPMSPFLEVARTATRDRLQKSSYALGSPTLMSPPFSPSLRQSETMPGAKPAAEDVGALPDFTRTRPEYGLTRRQPSFTGFSEGPGMEL
ncbi:hypothetical protein BGW42_000438 [Actinomortierella wolfii]|nr:hypothetical protein BGW42_000438 [Actinomortierella wolfii]